MNDFLLQLTQTGVKVVSDEAYSDRLNICNSCENLKADRCQLCSCMVKYISATHEGSCPINKW
jgi:hypothetical protein